MCNMRIGAIAQLGERLHGMQEVVGSIPTSSTISISRDNSLRSCLRWGALTARRPVGRLTASSRLVRLPPPLSQILNQQNSGPASRYSSAFIRIRVSYIAVITCGFFCSLEKCTLLASWDRFNHAVSVGFRPVWRHLLPPRDKSTSVDQCGRRGPSAQRSIVARPDRSRF